MGDVLKSEQGVLERVAELLSNWRKGELVDLVTGELPQGVTVGEISSALLSGIRESCHKFNQKVIYFPEFFLEIDTALGAMNALLPQLRASGEQSKAQGKVVLGTVEGDIHDMGKNILKAILESEGIPTIDLGTNVLADTFIQTAQDEAAPIIAASTLMTPTLKKMEELEAKLQQKGLKGAIWTIVGGEATSQEFANSIGADAWAREAIEGVAKIKQFLQNRYGGDYDPKG